MIFFWAIGHKSKITNFEKLYSNNFENLLNDNKYYLSFFKQTISSEWVTLL